MKKALFKFSQTKLGELIVGSAFGKLNKLLPVERLKENKYVLAFKHPKPAYKIHILIIPKRAIKNISDVKNFKYIEEVFKTAQELIKDLDLENKNYRIITNGGENQKVKQLHFHLISD